MKFVKMSMVVLSISLSSVISGAVHSNLKTDAAIMNSMVYVVSSRGVCTGALLFKNVVVTAAHCLDNGGKPEKVVLLSKRQEDKVCNTAKIVDSIYTLDAKPILPDDVHAPDLVLFKLESDLCTGVPVKLASSKLTPGDVIQQAGFGGGSGVWHKSHQLSVEILSSEGAKDLSTSDDEVFKELLRLSDEYYLHAKPVLENTTACVGDSGGPLFTNVDGEISLYAVAGAVFPNDEFGASKCNNGYLHLITPVAPCYDWMNAQVRLWKSK